MCKIKKKILFSQQIISFFVNNLSSAWQNLSDYLKIYKNVICGSCVSFDYTKPKLVGSFFHFSYLFSYLCGVVS